MAVQFAATSCLPEAVAFVNDQVAAALPMRSEHPELASPEKRCLLLFGHLCRLFLGPGFWLVARWNRLGEAVKTRKKREKTGKKWARYGLKGVKEGS